MKLFGAKRKFRKLLSIFILSVYILTFSLSKASAETGDHLEKPPSIKNNTEKKNNGTATFNHQIDDANKGNNQSRNSLSLSLKEAVAVALRDNLSARNAYLSRITDRFALKVSEDEFQPRISMVAGSRYSTTANTDDFSQNVGANISLNLPTGGQLGLSATTEHSNSGSTNSYDTNVNLNFSQPLLRGGGFTVGQANLVSARRAELSSQLSLQRNLSTIVTSVIRQYRRYVSSTRSLRIAELSLKRAEKQLEINQAFLTAGRIARIDLVQNQTSIANRQLSLQTAKNALRTESVNLLRSLRLPANTQLRLNNTISLPPLPKLTLAQAVKTAFQHRVDYRQTQLDLASSRLALKLAENEQQWDLSLEGSYAINGSANDLGNSLANSLPDGQGNYAVGLQVSIPLDKNLARKQSLLNARVGLIRARNSLIDLEESIRLELSQQLENVRFLWKQVELSQQALDLTQQQLESEQIKLQAGKINNIDLVNFNNDLITAENGHITTQVAYLNSLTDLDEALGLTLKKWGISLNRPFTENQIDRYSIQRR